VDSEKLYLKVPQGFEDFYNKDEVLFLQRTIYGLKQAASSIGILERIT